MNAIDICDLNKHYGSVVGVEGLSFSVGVGEVFGYLGPNGAGKTTTIRCLMGMLRATAGECRVLGSRVEAGRATEHARIGYLPGDFRTWPRLTARRTLELMERLGGRADPQTRARREALAERLELALDRPVGDLSKGNRQKVGLVQAFQHRPELLILDEPTSGLDPLMRRAVLELIDEARAEGATVFLSSHDLTEVAAVCGRTAILREGRLVKLGTMEELARRAENRLRLRFAAGGEPPETELAAAGGRLVRREDGWVEVAYTGEVGGVVKWAARGEVERVETPETTLEDAFFHYYHEAGGEDGRDE